MSELIADKNKKGLGRGLGSLLGSQIQPQNKENVNTQQLKASVGTQNIVSEGKVWQINIEKLKSGAFQPRKNFEKQSLEELAQSIKSSGLLQPIVVRKVGEQFEIVAGERRWRASQIAGLHEVPVIIKNYNDKETLELAIIENIQREDLNPIEEAEGFNRLMIEFKLSHQQIAEKVGKERVSVTNSLRLLALPEKIKEMLINSNISSGHAKVLLGVSDEEKQKKLAESIIVNGLSVRKLEQIIKSENEKASEPANKDLNVTHRLIGGLSDELQKLMATKVKIQYDSGKGKIEIHYYSDEELSSLVDHLKRGYES